MESPVYNLNSRESVLPQQSDNELMLGVQQGRLQLMGEIYERHHRLVFNFLIKLTGNRQLGEDMLQETFVRALRYASGYRANAKFTTWLLTIARNVSIDFWNEETGHHSESEWGLEAIEDERSDPGYLEELSDDARRLQLALLEVPQQQRELILLAKIKQLSIADLANMYGCSNGALKVRLHRAMEDLRTVYNRDSEQGLLYSKEEKQ
ncbi:MAG: sigma-70 family RNA polymerase sigma factor [Pseudomonadales bacterium]|nr:sigma-70 family RNA polymerase sigma factor [Pseudomonadales bacterium]